MAFESAGRLPGRDVPDLHRRIMAARGEPLAVRTERHAVTAVSLESAYHLALGDVPELHRRIVAGRGKPLAVRTERHVRDVTGVPRQFEDLPTGRRGPKCQSRIIPGCRGEPFPIRAERKRVTLEGVCLRFARASQTLIVPSPPAEASCIPSGLKAT